MQKTGRRGRSSGLNAARFAAGCIAALMVLSAGQAADPQTGLIGRWPLAESAQDASGNGHNGVLKGGAAFSAPDKALVLDGVDSYVNFGDVPIRADFSIGLWLCPDWPDDAKVMRLMGKFRLADLKVLALFSDEKGRLWVYISEDGAEDGRRSIVKATAEPVVAESGEWRFVVVRWDSAKAANGLGVLVDGSPVPVVAASEANIARLSTRKVDLTLGAYDIQTVTEGGVTRGIVRNPFRGMMSGLTIWDSALSDEAVAGLFAAGRVAKMPTTVPDTAATPAAAPLAAPPAQGKPDVDAIRRIADSLPVMAMTQRVPGDILSADRKKAALESLNAAVPDALLSQLADMDMIAYFEALWRVDRDKARRSAAELLLNAGRRNGLSLKVKARLAELAGRSDGREDVDYPVARDILDEIENATDNARKAGACDFETLRDLALALKAGFQDERAHQWAKVAADLRVAGGAPLARIREAADVLGKVGATGPGRGHKPLLDALLALADKGELKLDAGDAELLAGTAGTPELLGQLRQVVDAKADVGLGKILGSAYRHTSELGPWLKHAEARMVSASGSDRTVWTLIRGHADAYAVVPNMTLRRLRWLDRAMAEADTAGQRSLVVRERLLYYTEQGRPDAAVKYLERLRQEPSSAPPGTDGLLAEARARLAEHEQAMRLRAEAIAESRQNVLQAYLDGNR